MTSYLKYRLRNVEPLRIADDSAAQNGQTSTLHYIPGTTIRGLVINALAAKEGFEEKKATLFSDRVRFLNAYPVFGEEAGLPSPKGFYEDKVQKTEGRKEMYNVLWDGNVPPAFKRAGLGRFARLDGDCIRYTGIETGADLRIRINVEKAEDRTMFRSEAIAPGYEFAGAIASEDSKLLEDMRAVFGEEVRLGNARSAGMGRCRVLTCEISQKPPYEEYLPAGPQEDGCYMMLISHTAFRGADGEYTGLDDAALAELGQRLGVEKLRIRFCSTSVVSVQGYNRCLGGKIPSSTMYEQGSVFRLAYKGAISGDVLREVQDQGIGIRRNEGFGRVLFLDASRYEEIRYKEEDRIERKTDKEKKPLSEDDKKVLRAAAGAYYRGQLEKAMERYVVNAIGSDEGKRKVFGGADSSQLGTIEALIVSNRYDPAEAKKTLQEYFDHVNEKAAGRNIQKKRTGPGPFQGVVKRILQDDLEKTLGITDIPDKVMGIPREEILTQSREDQMKLDLIVKMIRFNNKKN